MKVAEYIARYLASRNVDHAFVVSGGACLHLIHAIAQTDGIQYYCNLHEQASAMAADGFARVQNRPAAVVATSGPGATNLLTGVASAYYDSVPMIVITGQVATFRSKGDSGVRQIGFQETDTVEIFRPVTKHAVKITSPSQVRYELERALAIALSGRPGPVLVDIPDDLQRADIDPERLDAYSAEEFNSPDRLDQHVRECLVEIQKSERPVLIVGWGVRLSNAVQDALDFARLLQIPIAPTWAVADILTASDPLRIGTFGTHGTRHGNFAVQNADLIIAVGCRLDTKATGSPPNTFARGAKKVVVDIDSAELNKFRRFDLSIDIPILADAGAFFRSAVRLAGNVEVCDRREWMQRIGQWKTRYPCGQRQSVDSDAICPYDVIRKFGQKTAPGDIIVLDTGCTLAWTMQVYEPKGGQRLLHDCNNTAMGWAIPASIGASLAAPGKRIFCLTGDGSLSMNIQELATIRHLNLPIKVCVFNNHGYSMIKQTQDQWLMGRYYASGPQGGIADPNFTEVAKAFGLRSHNICLSQEVESALEWLMEGDEPTLLDLSIPSDYRVVPQVKYGRPNEDAEPLLDRSEFAEQMIVPIHKNSVGS
jgi:acetolactate synthase-1/2/3 large subunit